MQGLVVLTDPRLTLETLAERAKSIAEFRREPDAFQVSRTSQCNECTLMVVVMMGERSYPAEFDPEELALVHALIRDPRPFVVTFNDLDLLKEVMFNIFTGESFVVADNDDNIILGDQFLAGLRQDTALAYLPRPYTRTTQS